MKRVFVWVAQGLSLPPLSVEKARADNVFCVAQLV